LFLVDVTEERLEIRRVNQAYEELTGLSTEDVTDNTPREIVGEEAGDQIVSRYRVCVEQRAPLEYDGGLSMTGDERSRHTILAPVVEDDEVTRLVGTTRKSS
jgi:PAS domain S-box-containing protein